MDRDGDTASIDERLREVARSRAIAVALLHGAAAADVDDVLQEANLAALAADTPHGGRFVAWLRGAVRHLARTTLRRRARRTAHEERAAAPLAQPSAAELALRLERHRELLAAVEQLSEPIRAVIVRRYLDEVPPRVIAEELGVPLATVKTRLRRGLAQLRETLSRDWGEELGGILIQLASTSGGVAPTAASAVPATAITHSSVVAAIATFLLRSKARTILVAGTAVIVAVATLPLLRGLHRSDEGASGGAVAGARQSSPTGDGSARLAEAGPSPVAAVRVRDDAPAKQAPPGSRLARLGERRLGSLAGRVVDEKGEGCGGVAVTIVRPIEAELNVDQVATDPPRLGERHETTSAPDGSFAFEVLARGSRFDVFAAGSDGRRARQLDLPVSHDATTLTLKPTMSIEGVVVDARDGTPVAGATVCVVNHRSDGRQRLDATTDGSGRFVIAGVEITHISVLAAAPDGRCSGSYSPSPDAAGAKPLRIEVGPGGAAAGTVVDDATGEPVADAAILLRPQDEVVATRTDERGEFTVRPTDVFTASMTHARVVASDGSWTDCELKVAKEPDDSPPTTIVRLRRGRRATGRIVDRDGEPVSGAVLVGSYGKESKHAFGHLTTTRSDGSFTLNGLPPFASPEILVRHDDCAWTAIPFPDGAADGGDVDLGTIRVGCGAFLSGTVFDADGRPSGEAFISLIQAEGPNRSARCDAQGRFEVAGVCAGRVTLQASVRGSAKPAELTLDVHDEEIVEPVRLTFPTGLSISGLVVDAGGVPVPGALVFLKRVGAKGHPVAQSLNCDEQGHFAFFGLDHEKCDLSVTPPSSPKSRALSTRVEGVMAGSTDLRLSLPNGAFVTGRVVDGNGAAIPGAQVNIHGTNAFVGGMAPTDQDGRFSILVAADAELSLDVRIIDPHHPGPLMQKPPAATVDHVRSGGAPVEIVIERR